MRKQLITSLLCGIGLVAMAQGEYDALKYSQGELLGTARYMGMAGAFGALGADMSAIHQNPAGIGLYRSSELSLTPVLSLGNVNANYNGTTVNNSKMTLQLNSGGYIGSFRPSNSTNVSNINFAVTYNKVKDFNRIVGIKDYNKPVSLLDPITTAAGTTAPANLSGLSYLAWETYLINQENAGHYTNMLGPGETVNPTMYMKEEGGIGELDLTIGANWAHFMYLGLGIGFQSVDYRLTSSYAETSSGYETFDPIYFDLRNAVATTGSGVNVKLGAIIKPFSFLRFGFALHSPTYYSLTDAFGTSLTSEGVDPNNVRATAEFSEETSSYELTVPGKMSYSLAYLFGQKGLISFDCEVVDYREMGLRDINGFPYDDTNASINNHMQTVYNMKLGGEYRITDNLSLRAGTAWFGAAYRDNMTADNTYVRAVGTTPHYAFDKGSRYYTGGLGYRNGAFFMDAAIANQQLTEDVFPFYDEPVYGENRTDNRYATIKTNRLNVVFSAGFKF
jgi:long-subunit fatty acid transport protein